MGKIRIFVDTNILVDYFSGRRKDGVAEKIMKLGRSDYYEMCTSMISANNVVYLKKCYREGFSPKDVSAVVRILPSTPEDWDFACVGTLKDFEDDLQLACAIHAGCSVILSRDHHFKDSPMPVYEPEEFLKLSTK